MTDTTQGEGLNPQPDDAALFQQATDDTTLEAFENPKVEPEKPPEKPAEKPAAEKPGEKPAETEVQSLSQRLREEAEARRRADRRAEEAEARWAAQQRQQAPQQPAKAPDLFEDPAAFVRSIVDPMLAQQAQQAQLDREARSRDATAQRFGSDMVTQSTAALEHFIKAGDPMAYATWQRAMQSHDPYGIIAGWYYERSLLHEVGGDLKSYKAKVLEEAMNDPDHRKRVLENTRSQAQASGSHAFRPPVTNPVPNLPSLGNIGAGGGDQPSQEPSDEELFRAAISAKRR